ncbi:MAG: hypothetical protein BWY31_01222 [Lentisphaerae bacterium ADurb.Bin242]|nr:MAG: hypothetical protein BWY31_01222 [Lentisphaerae bacterium ADurb.Bin242]
MGTAHAKIFFLILLSAVLSAGTGLRADDGTGSSASLTNFALPEYSGKDNRLQFILYGEKASNLGTQVYLTNPKIDLVNDNVKDINEVISLADETPYPLTLPADKVAEYWVGKSHCRALFFSQDAEYDKNTRLLKSDSPVYFRSREIAVNGVGFDADYNRKFIHIRNKVRMVIYPDMRKRSGIPSRNAGESKPELPKPGGNIK